MMERWLKQLHIAARAIHFDEERKRALRGRLQQFIEAHEAVAERTDIRNASERRPRFPLARKLAPTVAGIALVVAAGGGTSLAAESSLPGDLLYGMKVKVNEEVRAALALTAEDGARWDIRRAERRLEEAEELVLRSADNASVESRLELSFAAHADRVNERIDEFAARGDIRAAADVASRFEASLRAHERILAKVFARSDVFAAAVPAETGRARRLAPELGDKASVAPLSLESGAASSAKERTDVTPAETEDNLPAAAEPETRQALALKVRSNITRVRNVRAGLESQIAANEKDDVRRGARSAAERKLKSAAGALAAAENFIELRSGLLDREARGAVGLRLAAAREALAKADAKLAAGAYGDTFNLGNEAIRIAEEARRLVGARTDLRIKVDLNGEGTRGDGRGDADGAEDRNGAPRAENDLETGDRFGSGGLRGEETGEEKDSDGDHGSRVKVRGGPTVPDIEIRIETASD